MLIDWFTVTAQIVNFLILVGLLKYFFYDRIISAMDQREETIRGRFEQAEKKASDAEEEKKSLQNRQADIERKKQEILSEAKDQAEEERKHLIDEAREEAAELKTKWEAMLEKEKENVTTQCSFQNPVICH